MAAAGGAASIITQVQQGGPAPMNNLAGTKITIVSILAAATAYADSEYRRWPRRAYHIGPKV